MYYGSYYGCDWWPVLLLKNLLRPSRFLMRWRYGQLRSDISTPLARDGIVKTRGRYADFADQVTLRHPLPTEPQVGYQGVGYLPTNETILDLILNEELLDLLAEYFGRQPYLREPLHHSIAFPTEDMPATRDMNPATQGFNLGWHYDTPNLVQLMILLNDVTEQDSHMQYARGEHRRWRTHLTSRDYYYSDEYAAAHFDIVKCIGPKGTAYLFDTNAPHRFYQVKHSLRAMVKVGYTPGNDILWRKHLNHPEYIVRIPAGYDLTPMQTEAARLAR